MADKEERKKKKKSKKAEEAASEPPPAQPEEEQAWPPTDIEASEAVEETPEGENIADETEKQADEDDVELMEEFPEPIEKKKSPYPVFWDRPKARFYKINFDYGENYYRDMVDYLDTRCTGVCSMGGIVQPPPPAKSWAERAHRSASKRFVRQDCDINTLLANIRSNIRNYDNHHREYTASIQHVYRPKAF